MTSAATLEAALASDDFSLAQAALDSFLASFRSGDRSLAEVSEALQLVDRSLSAAVTRRMKLAGELARLRHLHGGYRPPRISTTWHVEA
jgi:hypothetical protein